MTFRPFIQSLTRSPHSWAALTIAALCGVSIAPFSPTIRPVLAAESIAQSPSTQPKSWQNARLIRTIQDTNLVPGSPGLTVISPDNRLVASVVTTQPNETPRSIRVWDLTTGRSLYTLSGHTDFVSDLAFSPDGRTLATVDYNIENRLLTVRLWNAATGQALRTMVRAIAPKYYNGAFFNRALVTFSPDSQTLYTSAVYPVIQVWDVNRGTLLRSLVSHRETIRGLAVSPDGRSLATTHVDGRLAILNLQNQQVRVLTGGSDAFEVAFSPDGETIAGTFEFQNERLVHTWNTIAPDLTQTTSGFSAQTWLVLSPDGRTYATSLYGSGIQLRDLTDAIQDPRLVRRQLVGRSHNFAFSPDGSLFVAATPNGLRIWR